MHFKAAQKVGELINKSQLTDNICRRFAHKRMVVVAFKAEAVKSKGRGEGDALILGIYGRGGRSIVKCHLTIKALCSEKALGRHESN